MSYERLVELKRWQGVGFGFSVIGGSDTHIPPMICALVRDSPAVLSKQVFVGDVLHKVNGINVANLETKEVVDLLRNCEEYIVLSLKEDRLAKLKARPFLAEDTLIEPPRSTINTYSAPDSPRSKTRFPSNGSPGSPCYERNEKRFHKLGGLRIPLAVARTHNRHGARKDSDMDSQLTTYGSNSQQISPAPTANSYTDCYSSKTYPMNDINCILKIPHGSVSGTKKYPSEVFTPTHMSNSISDSRVPFHNDVSTVSRCQASRPSSGQTLIHTMQQSNLDIKTMNHKVSNPTVVFDFDDGCTKSYMTQNQGLFDRHRRYSNPREDYGNKSFSESDSNIVPYDIACDTQYEINNYSSPNICKESDVLYAEHKDLSMMPTTQSQHSLDQNVFYDEHDSSYENCNQRHLSPLSFQALSTSQNSQCSSSLSPSSHSGSPGGTTGVGNNEVSAADIASRLFSLNGYKESDVAPILGKNSEFSQQVCGEYLRFFSFDGLSLDDSLRVFLKKFPLTGETQERERILVHFSKRFYECNKTMDMSEDALHTLTCALMLLNTDLHRHGITNKMSLNDFINNLSGLSDGKDFSKEYLKTLYNAIKSKEIVFASTKSDSKSNSPKILRKGSAPGNPFLELKTDANDLLLCEGLIYKKSVMDPGGRKTPAMKRNWRPFYCALKGLVLYSYKSDNTNAQDPHTLGIHHALAGYAKDYKKRAYVFKLITADWSVIYIQVKNQNEVKRWMDSINVTAALLSSPPLPAPCGSSMRFQRPVMPVSRTKLTLEEQFAHHIEKVKELENDLSNHRQFPPESQSKQCQDWENKLDYLEFEIKRFKAYLSVLTAVRLEPIRERILSSLNKSPKTCNDTEKSRSTSMNVLVGQQSHEKKLTHQEYIDEHRQSYCVDTLPP